MAVNSRSKGATGENLVRDLLRTRTGLVFERTPGSGSGVIKGDLHVPKQANRYCIEVKNYAESPLTDKVFTNKTNNLIVWWTKLKQQAIQCNQKPLLLYRYNRSKLFVVTEEKPANVDKFLYFSWLDCYTMLAEEWLEKERIIWLNS
jgi:Holliday junction resolvase